MKITQKMWNSMSSNEKYLHLKNGRKKLNSICGIDGDSKVGDAKVSRYFYITVDGVTISENFLTESEAYANADKNIRSWGET